jgi:hypothetical protein
VDLIRVKAWVYWAVWLLRGAAKVWFTSLAV